MGARVSGEAFESPCKIDELADLRIARVEAPQLLFLFERLVEGDADLERNELCDLVDVAVVMAEHAAHVADHRLGGQRSVGDDLRNALATILVGDILYDPVAPFHAEIDVEVRHRDAFRIQEPLEQKVMLDRVEIRDAENERHQRSRARAATRPHRHAMLARPPDEVGDDQKVARESHAADHAELERQSCIVAFGVRCFSAFGSGLIEPHRESTLRLFAEEIFRGAARRHGVGRQHGGAQLDLEGASLGDLDAVGEQLRRIGKELAHLRRRL